MATRPPETPAAPAEGAPPADSNAFSDAFAAAVADDLPPPETPPAAPETPPPADTPPAAPETPPATPPADAPPADAPPADTPPAGESADDVLKRLAAAVAAQPQAPAPTPTPETPPAPAADTPIYNDDEVAILTAYEKDWPEVARAESLKRKAEYHDLLKHVFGEVMKYVGPIRETVDTLAGRTHADDIRTQAPDFDAHRDNVIAWVDSDEHPAYLQTAYKQVMQTGTAAEVADLIGRYKQAKGIVTPPAAAPTPPAPAPKAELSSAAKQAAADLAPVSTSRTVVPQQDDPNDYSAAFDKYAGAAGL